MKIPTILSAILAAQLAVPMLAQKYQLRLFNVDDSITATISNSASSHQPILDAVYGGDTGFVDISEFVRPGSNTIHLSLHNENGGYTYGYQFLIDGITIDSQTCGTSGVLGCGDNDQNRPYQIINIHDILFQGPSGGVESHVVRIIYLIPADRVFNMKYAEQIEKAIRNLQIWYRNEIGTAATFQLHSPVIEPYATSHSSAWYGLTPNGPSSDNYFWSNTIQDGFALTGGRFWDPNNRWIFYIDAPRNGQRTGAADGVAVLHREDLEGLIDPNSVCRWVGGLGHELGHSFGLPHPTMCPGSSCPESALMWLGYTTYPNAYLLSSDKSVLSDSPFFKPVELPSALPSCAAVSSRGVIVSFSYPGGGSFTREGNEWVEQTPEGSMFTFAEQNRDGDYIYLFDESRLMKLRLPIVGGLSSWRIDDGPWIDLYVVEPQYGSR